MAKNKRWTEEEYEYLRNYWGVKSINTIANTLNRTPNAIKLKAGRMKLGAFLNNGDYVTFSQVCKAFGQSYTWTLEVWKREGCPIKNKRVGSDSFLVIDMDKFWKWSESHKSLIRFERLEKNALGIEPKWLQTERKVAFQNKRKTTQWTKQEDAELEYMIKNGKYHIDEIAEKLGRSEAAVKRRKYDLCLDDFKIKRHKNTMWNEEEITTLLKLKAENFSFDEIGKRIGRSGSACRGKMEKLLNPNMNKREFRRKTKDNICWVAITENSVRQYLKERNYGTNT